MNPKTEALAFRIWAYCDPIDWNCTPQHLADAMGVTPGAIRNVLGAKRWGGRLWVEKRDYRIPGIHTHVAMDTIDGGSFIEAFRSNGIPVRGKSQEMEE